MAPGSRSEPLSQLEVLVVDCQATAAAPRGHLLEIGWARIHNTIAHASLIALPDGEQIRQPLPGSRGAPVALRLGVAPALRESRLASAVWWV
jgi:hypothetical protein